MNVTKSPNKRESAAKQNLRNAMKVLETALDADTKIKLIQQLMEEAEARK